MAALRSDGFLDLHMPPTIVEIHRLGHSGLGWAHLEHELRPPNKVSTRGVPNNNLVLLLTRHTLARAGLANVAWCARCFLPFAVAAATRERAHVDGLVPSERARSACWRPPTCIMLHGCGRPLR